MLSNQDPAYERFRHARQLNIFIMMAIGAHLFATKNPNSQILSHISRVLGALLGAALGRSPEFFSQLRNKNLLAHDILKACLAIPSLLIAFILSGRDLHRNPAPNISQSTRLAMYSTVFSVIGPELLDQFAIFVANNESTSSVAKFFSAGFKQLANKNRWTNGLAKYLTAGYTPPTSGAFVSSETITQYTRPSYAL